MHTLSLKQISSTENYQPNSSYLLAWPPEETTVNIMDLIKCPTAFR